jgi:uncharacterized membrane protein YkvA (DUF1232 family)
MKADRREEPPALNAEKMADLAAWVFSGNTAHIDEFILAGSSGIRSEHLHAIAKESQSVYEKIDVARDAGLSDLKAYTRLIMQALESAARSDATDPLPSYLAEGTFAAQYLIKEHDLIPDSVPGMGLIDDAILIKRVFSRNEAEFMRLEMRKQTYALAYEAGIKVNTPS